MPWKAVMIACSLDVINPSPTTNYIFQILIALYGLKTYLRGSRCSTYKREHHPAM